MMKIFSITKYEDHKGCAILRLKQLFNDPVYQ